ncbi:MAG: BatA domain-containing protein [Mucilaginibacter sp.]|nr:BatA domain-containing protein [Mucilaginibacter sp.]
MIFLHPIWFFALAAISIPVAIHLWNIRKGRTLKVGSITLITAASQKRSLSLRLNDVLLLLLRCLLLTLLAIVLTMPLWRQDNNFSKTQGWILIPKASLKEAYQKFKPMIDSLIKSGFEFHYFDKDFAKADFNKVLADTTLHHNSYASHWTLAQQLNGQIKPSLPVYLLTSNSAVHFTGEKPSVSLNLHWQTFTPADSVSTWIAKAWLTNNGAIEMAEGVSHPSGTFYQNYTIRSGDQSTNFTVRSDSGKLSIGLKNANELIPVDTSTWRFAIYADKNSIDASYLKAALQSIIQFTRHKAVVKQYTDANQLPSQQNWLFWLSAKPVNKKLQSDNMFVYENGKTSHSNSWIETESDQKIALYKSITGNRKGFAIWKDGFGNPVLSLENQSGKNRYHFYNRFDPAWSDLVWSDEFPKMLLKLIIGPATEPNSKYDKRILSDQQIMPNITNERSVSIGKVTEHIDLSRYLWLLLVLIFFAERWLAHRNTSKPVSKNG